MADWSLSGARTARGTKKTGEKITNAHTIAHSEPLHTTIAKCLFFAKESETTILRVSPLRRVKVMAGSAGSIALMFTVTCSEDHVEDP